MSKEELAKDHALKFKSQVSSEGLQNIESDFIAGYEAKEAESQWMPVVRGSKQFMGWAFVQLGNPVTKQKDIAYRFLGGRKDFMWVTHYMPYEKPLPPKP